MTGNRDAETVTNRDDRDGGVHTVETVTTVSPYRGTGVVTVCRHGLARTVTSRDEPRHGLAWEAQGKESR